MSDTRNHTTRDQLAETIAAHRVNYHHRNVGPEPVTADSLRYTSCEGCDWLGGHRDEAGWEAHLADALLASDAIAAVRAAAVAETTAAIEAVLNPEGHPNGRDYGRAAVWSDDVRAALSGGRTALDTTLAQARADAWEGAADDPGEPNAIPTPAQLLRRLADADADQRLAWADQAIVNSEKAHDCFMRNHRGRIAHLERELAELRADTGADQ